MKRLRRCCDEMCETRSRSFLLEVAGGINHRLHGWAFKLNAWAAVKVTDGAMKKPINMKSILTRHASSELRASRPTEHVVGHSSPFRRGFLRTRSFDYSDRKVTRVKRSPLCFNVLGHSHKIMSCGDFSRSFSAVPFTIKHRSGSFNYRSRLAVSWLSSLCENASWQTSANIN